ncbi:hypothetical protein [Elioraea rosea]|uniref:hypothetical protein n=1 Tax=Elioraea rosea TaxID=2492390 RepID=UPI0011842606|nr:hypothetical protein [Elioraea rosea]
MSADDTHAPRRTRKPVDVIRELARLTRGESNRAKRAKREAIAKAKKTRRRRYAKRMVPKPLPIHRRPTFAELHGGRACFGPCGAEHLLPQLPPGEWMTAREIRERYVPDWSAARVHTTLEALRNRAAVEHRPGLQRGPMRPGMAAWMHGADALARWRRRPDHVLAYAHAPAIHRPT